MKFWLRAFPYSLRLTLPLLILGLGSGANFIYYQQILQSSHERVEREGVQQANFTAGQTAALLEYLYRDQHLRNSNEGIRLVINQIRGAKNLKTILLTDDHNQILLSNQAQLEGKPLEQADLAPNLAMLEKVRSQLAGQTEHRENQGQEIRAFYPVRLALQPGELQASRIGILAFSYSLQQPLQQSAEDARQKGLLSSVILSIVGLALWGLCDRLITRRANRLVAISQRWASGKLSDRVTLAGSDEFAQIGTALNQMASSLEIGTAAIKSSELQLRQRGEELETTLAQLQSTQSQLVQTEKMSSLGQMVAGIAHEVNNPIGFIHGNITHVNRYAEELLGLVSLYQHHYPEPIAEIESAVDAIDLDFLREDFPNIIGSMKMGTERVREIVLSLRNFSRLDESATKTVNLHEGIESTLLILQHRFKAAAAAITLTKQYGDLPLVHCYAGQINQVFMNILSNALDAIAEHGLNQPGYAPEITIRTETLGGDHVRIGFIDNGPGMPESVRKRLFDPFFTTKEVGKGTGLGLSISYQIVVEKHQGKLECRSALQQGTEFWIELPVQSAASRIESEAESSTARKALLSVA
jgi:signal transduction histidine kinase